VDLVLNRGAMAVQEPKKYPELEFLNITNPVQRQDAAHQKKARKHAISHYWQARKDLARSFALPVDRQLLPFPTPPGCVCHGLGYIENEGSRKPCVDVMCLCSSMWRAMRGVGRRIVAQGKRAR
jgi:hypothetical protein